MPDNPNTDIPPIETEAWEIAFKPYGAYPKSAYDLARHLMAVKQFLQTQPPDVSGAAASLDQACETLFPLSEFHAAGHAQEQSSKGYQKGDEIKENLFKI